MNKIFTTIMVIVISLQMISQEIAVALYYERELQGVTITIQKGNYLVYNNNQIVDTLLTGNIISIIRESNYLVYRNRTKAWASDKNIKIIKNSDEGSFFINYSGSVEPARCYDGWLVIKNRDYSILPINYVDIDSYVAAVVEGLGTGMASEEFFKAQAIMFRTFALINYGRHSKENFDLCDGTHCQLYKSKSTNRIILNAAKKTTTLVLVDKYKKFVNPIYHLNSGGYTAPAEFVYGNPESHLQSVKDTFAVNGENYKWKILIPAAEWQTYLVKKGLKSASQKLYKQLLIEQKDTRLKEYKIGNESINLNTIKTDWGWESSYFTMSLDKGVITINGNGNGSGVGMSLESAKVMATKGLKYDFILKFFYKDVLITNLNHLNIYSEILQNSNKEKP